MEKAARSTRVAAVAALWACAVLVGCESVPGGMSGADAPAHRRPARRAASMVFDSPRLRKLEAAHPAVSEDGLPWYAARNDARLTVEGGYQGATVDDSINYTYDRQYQSGGHVRDHYSSTTRRRSHTGAVR